MIYPPSNNQGGRQERVRRLVSSWGDLHDWKKGIFRYPKSARIAASQSANSSTALLRGLHPRQRKMLPGPKSGPLVVRDPSIGWLEGKPERNQLPRGNQTPGRVLNVDKHSKMYPDRHGSQLQVASSAEAQ